MLKVEYINIDIIKTYPNNAKLHPAEQIEQIKKSIEEFGMNDPLAIWKDNYIIEGHGRYVACKELGIKKVPVIRLDSLTDEQRKAYALVHNKVTMNTGFNMETLMSELEEMTAYDLSEFGIDYSDNETNFEDYYEETAGENYISITCDGCGCVFKIDKKGNVIE